MLHAMPLFHKAYLLKKKKGPEKSCNKKPFLNLLDPMFLKYKDTLSTAINSNIISTDHTLITMHSLHSDYLKSSERCVHYIFRVEYVCKETNFNLFSVTAICTEVTYKNNF